jgi:G-protein coupled receptor 98
MSLPASSIPHVTVQEEDGEVRFLVVRAQGLLGRVTAQFRTVSLTAFSPEDYQVHHKPFEAACASLK